MGSPKQFVLGYGSLLNLESAGKTLGRLVRPEDVVPVEVEDHLRLWNLVAPVQLIERGNEWVNAVFLDLQPRPGYRANGILIEVSPAELDNLDIREQNYTRLDISAKTADRPDHGTVFAYVGKPEFFRRLFRAYGHPRTLCRDRRSRPQDLGPKVHGSLSRNDPGARLFHSRRPLPVLRPKTESSHRPRLIRDER